MPDVNEIIKRLRERAWEAGALPRRLVVDLPDAVAAVREAAQPDAEKPTPRSELRRIAAVEGVCPICAARPVPAPDNPYRGRPRGQTFGVSEALAARADAWDEGFAAGRDADQRDDFLAEMEAEHDALALAAAGNAMRETLATLSTPSAREAIAMWDAAVGKHEKRRNDCE